LAQGCGPLEERRQARAMADADAVEIEKKIRAVRKKLTQIEKLKEKTDLDPAALEKVASEPGLMQELAVLEARLAGEPEPVAAAPPAAAPTEVQVAAPAPEPVTVPALSPAEQEKRLKALRKKLKQIEQLKEKGGELDADAREKVASEAALLAEVAALERGDFSQAPAQTRGLTSAPAPTVPSGEQTSAPATEAGCDPHAAERAVALEPPPQDLGLMLDDEAEKRFKALQKKLRDIGKLHEKDRLDKLQQEKLGAEPGLIAEIQEIRGKAEAVLAARRARYAESKVAKPKAEPKVALRKPEGEAVKAKAAEVDDDEEEPVVDKSRPKESMDLKTNRQKKPPTSSKKNDEDSVIDPRSVTWPEVLQAVESGDRGTDKSRQQKALAVNEPSGNPPYKVFDSTLLKCGFLSRVELRLAPEVLTQESFMMGFPGALGQSLVELILKENALPAIPPGIDSLTRIRSIDLSKNAIVALPGAETWQRIAGSLELLDLSLNKLSSIAELAPLTKLSALKVDGNRITSLNGVNWKELKQLAVLSALGNEIEELPEAVSERAESLEHLELAQNKITSVPAAICELRKLKTLSMGDNPIKDQKVARYLENGGRGIKELKAYLSKSGKKR